jgi:hypothetical protein
MFQDAHLTLGQLDLFAHEAIEAAGVRMVHDLGGNLRFVQWMVHRHPRRMEGILARAPPRRTSSKLGGFQLRIVGCGRRCIVWERKDWNVSRRYDVRSRLA